MEALQYFLSSAFGAWMGLNFKVLVVFMGVDQYMDNNWEGLFERV